MWGSKSLIKEGIIQRVGNGQEIKVWGDKRPPTLSTHKVQSPVNILLRDAAVAKLINNEGSWNVYLIQQVMNEEEA